MADRRFRCSASLVFWSSASRRFISFSSSISDPVINWAWRCVHYLLHPGHDLALEAAGAGEESGRLGLGLQDVLLDPGSLRLLPLLQLVPELRLGMGEEGWGVTRRLWWARAAAESSSMYLASDFARPRPTALTFSSGRLSDCDSDSLGGR